MSPAQSSSPSVLAPSQTGLLAQGGGGIKPWPCGRGTGSLGQVRPNQRVIASSPSDSPTGMSKRTGSITCFSGTRKGVLTNGPARPSGGDLEPERRFAKWNLEENPILSAGPGIGCHSGTFDKPDRF